MAVMERLIADIWADPHVRVQSRCDVHPAGSVDCLLCQVRIVARWDVTLAQRLWCLYADYSFTNLLLLRRYMCAAGIEHHWHEAVSAVRDAVEAPIPFTPDLPHLEV